MSDLLKVISRYGDYDRKSIFALYYKTLPSEVLLEVPLDTSKKNMEELLKLISLEEEQYEVIIKNWNTEDSSNSDHSKDFPSELLYKHPNKSSLIWISLANDTLEIEFLYDCTDDELEKWNVKINHKVRSRFGLSRTPTFKVLTKDHGSFETEDVRTESSKIDIESNYNDDFSIINETILSSFESNESGLILLHGAPGTGKTSYIKNLISTKSELNFIFIQNEFVNNLLDPDFISFLLKQRNSVLVIEDAEKVIKSRSQLKEDSVVSTILQLTDGLFSDYLNIKIICTFNSNLSEIDSALLRKGRMIAMYEFKPLQMEKTNELLSKLGASNSDEELTIADIYNHKEKDFGIAKKDKIGF